MEGPNELFLPEISLPGERLLIKHGKSVFSVVSILVATLVVYPKMNGPWPNEA